MTAVALAACGGSSTNGATAFVPSAPVNAEWAIPKTYVLTDLGTGLPGSPGLVPAAINNQGMVVGEASVGILGQLPSCSPSTCGPPEGWIFNKGTLSELAPLSGDSYTFADDINSAGMVVGGSAPYSTYFPEKAVLWGTDGSPIDLGTGFLGSQSAAEATAINDSREIVGVSYDPYTGDEIPTGFHLDGKTTAPCGKTTEAMPWAINNAGLLIGTSFLGSGGEAAIECPPLVTIVGPPPSNPSWVNYGFGINDKGQAVGRLAIGPGPEFHPFLYYKGKTTDLGTLFPGSSSSVAFAFSINQSGVIVGWSAAASGSPPVQAEAFVYADGRMVDLNTLLPPSVRKIGRWWLHVRSMTRSRSSDPPSSAVTPTAWNTASCLRRRAWVGQSFRKRASCQATARRFGQRGHNGRESKRLGSSACVYSSNGDLARRGHRHEGRAPGVARSSRTRTGDPFNVVKLPTFVEVGFGGAQKRK